jgi:hypothetical protein
MEGIMVYYDVMKSANGLIVIVKKGLRDLRIEVEPQNISLIYIKYGYHVGSSGKILVM